MCLPRIFIMFVGDEGQKKIKIKTKTIREDTENNVK